MQHTASVTCQKRMLTPLWHLILPQRLYVCRGPCLYCSCFVLTTFHFIKLTYYSIIQKFKTFSLLISLSIFVSKPVHTSFVLVKIIFIKRMVLFVTASPLFISGISLRSECVFTALHSNP